MGQRALEALPVIVAIAAWLVVAIQIRPGIDFLLSFALVLLGASALCVWLLSWAKGRLPTSQMLAACAFATLIIISGGIDLAALPGRPSRFLSVFISFLILFVVVYLGRLSNRRERE